MIMRALLWGFCLPFLPICWLQGWYFKKKVRVLNPPPDEPSGSLGADASHPPLNIIGVGDSVIEGWGLCSFRDSVTALVGDGVAQATHRSIQWRALGRHGAKAHDIARMIQVEETSSVDIAVVSVGVNDVVGLTSLLQWQRAIFQIVSQLRDRSPVKILFLGVPPMHGFDRIPQPLRGVLGIRAQMLDLVVKRSLAGLSFARHVPLNPADLEGGMAIDGFHPSLLGPQAIAAAAVLSAHELLHQFDKQQ